MPVSCEPVGTPADGADGADVVLVCDPSVDNLLHLHRRDSYAAPKVRCAPAGWLLVLSCAILQREAGSAASLQDMCCETGA